MADAEMRALIVSDIHSNLEALGSVLRDAESGGGFDSIWSLGDLVGYGPDPEACIDLMRGHGGLRVAGNHDLAVSGRMGLEWFNTYAAAAARWTADRLEEEHVEYLSGLSLRVETDGFTAVHGSPRDPVWEYVVTAESARVTLEGFDTPRCLVGHSHIPFICRIEGGSPVFDLPTDRPVEIGDERIIVNPGSVGQPRDGDPRASYAVYDASAGTIAHRRVEYDVPATQRKMTERGLPRYLAERLAHGR